MPIPLLAAMPAAPVPPLAVLVVDDQAVVRDGVARLILAAAIPLRDVATAATPAEALAAAARLRPDVVVLDADLGGSDGLALIPLLAPAPVLVLSCHGDAATRSRAMRLGALAFVEKHRPAAELLGTLLRLAHPQARGEEPPRWPGAGSRVAAVTSSDVVKAGGP